MSPSQPKVWYRTEFAFPSGDRCQCYKHQTKNHNPKRCPNRDTVIGLTDPARTSNDLHRLYCLDCWLLCREEHTQINPAQARLWQQQRKEGWGLATGC